MSEEYVTKAISLPRSVAERVAKAAEQERRNFSNMVAVLCENQLAMLEQVAAPTESAISAER